MTNPFYDPYQVLTKVYGAGAHLKLALADTPIEELHRARTVRTVYGVLEHDGYLTACPTNVGTGMRASVMLFLSRIIPSASVRNAISALS